MSAAWLLALALQATPPALPDWERLGTYEGIDTSYHPGSVRRIGEGRVSVRVRGIIAAPGPDGIKTATGLLEIDCAANSATTVEVRGLDADGALVLNALIPLAERRPEPIRPASPNAAIRDQVCRSSSP